MVNSHYFGKTLTRRVAVAWAIGLIRPRRRPPHSRRRYDRRLRIQPFRGGIAQQCPIDIIVILPQHYRAPPDSQRRFRHFVQGAVVKVCTAIGLGGGLEELPVLNVRIGECVGLVHYGAGRNAGPL